MLIYSNIKNKKTYVEWWGGSTKHPDVQRCYQDDVEKERFTPNEFLGDEYSVFQWLVMCCSDLSFGTNSSIKDLLEMTKEYTEPLKRWG